MSCCPLWFSFYVAFTISRIHSYYALVPVIAFADNMSESVLLTVLNLYIWLYEMSSYVLEHDIYSISVLNLAPACLPENHKKHSGKWDIMNCVVLLNFLIWMCVTRWSFIKKQQCGGSFQRERKSADFLLVYGLDYICGYSKGLQVKHLYSSCYIIFTYCTVCVKS